MMMMTMMMHASTRAQQSQRILLSSSSLSTLSNISLSESASASRSIQVRLFSMRVPSGGARMAAGAVTAPMATFAGLDGDRRRRHLDAVSSNGMDRWMGYCSDRGRLLSSSTDGGGQRSGDGDAGERKKRTPSTVSPEAEAERKPQSNVNEKGVEIDKAETAMQAANMASRMLFPWERRQFDGGQLTWWEKLYWIILIPSVAYTIVYALRNNDWEDLKQGRLSPTLEEKAVAEASRKREERMNRLEELRRKRMHEERRRFGLREQQDKAGETIPAASSGPPSVPQPDFIDETAPAALPGANVGGTGQR